MLVVKASAAADANCVCVACLEQRSCSPDEQVSQVHHEFYRVPPATEIPPLLFYDWFHRRVCDYGFFPVHHNLLQQRPRHRFKRHLHPWVHWFYVSKVPRLLFAEIVAK